VGQNSGPFYRRLWTKVHLIKFACSLQRRFPIDSLAAFRRYSRSSCKVVRNRAEILILCSAKIFFGGGGVLGAVQISNRILQIWVTIELCCLVTIGQATSEIGGEKKKDYKRQRGKTEWPTASILGGRL